MPSFKKLAFAPLFLTFYALLLYNFAPFLKSYDFIFSLTFDTFAQLLILASLFILAALFFVIFACLCQDLKLVVPIGILASFLPMLFVSVNIGIVLLVGGVVSFILTFVNLENKLKSYLTFNPSFLLGPSIRSLVTFLIIFFSFSYYLSINQLINTTSFQIPDSLIDTTLKFTPKTELPEESSKLPISQEQINILKKNPEALKQYGLDPKILDSLNQAQTSLSDSTNNLIRSAVKAQLEAALKPYQNLIPSVLGVLMFFTLQSLSSFINLFIYPLLWLIFYILEKTNFIKFEVEQRPVKKMLV
jgi:hypothetical protein